jgi:hypothetical protein
METKEYRRGKVSANQYFGKFRSFKKDDRGRIIGYKKSGSTEVIGKPSRERLQPGSFYAGWREAEKKVIASKPVRRPTSSGQGYAFGMKIKPFRF